MKKIVLIALILFLSNEYVAAEIIYVKHNAGGANNGSSWANAYTNLQAAMDAAVAGDTLFVAGGVYKPTSAPDGVSVAPRDKSFHLATDIKIFGGFAGTETLLAQRDYALNETILSGDFNNDDAITGSGATLSISNNSENAYHVFMLTTAASAKLDGFTIKGGNANGSSTIYLNGNQFFRVEGGGIYVRIGNMQLSNLKIMNNSAGSGGGLNLQANGHTVITKVNIEKNVNNGLTASSQITLSNSTISGNKGRGVNVSYNNASIIQNSVFSFNSNSGIYSNRNTTIVNCTFYENSAAYGGGIYLEGLNPSIKNCIFWNNYASSSSGGVFSDVYSDYESPTVEYCLMQEGTAWGAGAGSITNQNPLFVNAEQGDFRLLSGSPALDEGNNTAIAGVLTDIAGNDRIQNTTVDMGAYEGAVTSLPRVYVDSTAAGIGTGANWTDAYTDVQDAIDNLYGATEIWVAKGTYLPMKDHTGNASPTEPRDKNFHMAADRQLYGGFTGSETELSQRNVEANPTILSGDIDNATDPDVVTGSGSTLSITGNSGNAFHVMITANLTSAAIIDGFQFKGGRAYFGVDFTYVGETFDARGYGGGMYNASSSPMIMNSTFFGNSAINYGGGLYNADNSSPNIMNSEFSHNQAQIGGGLFNTNLSSPVIMNANFTSNLGISQGGGIYNSSSSAIITNSTFFNNEASTNGGAIYNKNSTITITNNIFWENTKGSLTNVAGADIENDNSTPVITNCLTQENSLYSSGTGVINNQDPLFTDAANGDFTLLKCSPAINKGDNAAWTATGLSTDLAGNTRPFGTSVVDMGAYEFQGNNPFTNAIYVKQNATGDNDGSTWANALTDLQDAINNQCGDLAIWVATGTYLPTSTSDRTISFSIPDGLKIYGGFAGTETLLTQRDWTAHETILSGDIGNQNDNTDNSYHVVYTKNVSSETLMDGFTVSDGKAEVLPLRNGGGWYNDGSGSGNSSNPTLSNCTFSDNSAIYGGAIYNNGTSNGVSSPTLSNCTFLGNSAAAQGGAIYNHGINSGDSSPTLSNCTFLGNSAVEDGGAMYFSGDAGSVKAEVINCTFQDNGNDHIGYDDAEQGTQPHFVNCTFTGATGYAIGIPNWDSGEAPLDFTNCIFWGNNGDILGGDAGTDNARLNITNSIVEEADFTLGAFSSNNNINQDPKFVDAANGFLQLKCNSPAINLGTLTGAPSTDYTGFTRVGNPDMGAYEYGQAVVNRPIPDASNPILSGIPILKASSRILNTNTVLYQGVNNVQLLPGFSVAPTGGAATVFRAEIGGGCYE